MVTKHISTNDCGAIQQHQTSVHSVSTNDCGAIQQHQTSVHSVQQQQQQQYDEDVSYSGCYYYTINYTSVVYSASLY